MTERVRRLVRIQGVVQGVGFRPFVHSLAHRMALAGHVGNDVNGVFVAVEGPSDAIERFLRAVADDAPPLASIEKIAIEQLPTSGEEGFRIVASEDRGFRQTLVCSDSATCDDCLRELFDPADRRFRHAFVNCTNCGPRFTIVRDVPYDRPTTTMASFEMCRRCAAEYADPHDRRYHAQPVCCPDCGPRLRLVDAGGVEHVEPVDAAVTALKRGEILAVKGIGGYHLAVDGTNEDAVASLRKRKHREDKPFAVMVSDIHTARELCHVDAATESLLTSRRRPIVLADRRPGGGVAESVAPANRQLGLMLPYSPLHHLLCREFANGLVLTSGNVSDEPIAHVDAEARERLSGIAHAFLSHDRPIHVRADDSVARVFRGRPMLLRRSRGYVPEPLSVAWEFPNPVLACGAELKSTFSIARNRHVFVSHHIGDLENHETLRSFVTGIEHFQNLFDIAPTVVAHDLHPEYLSSKHALGMGGVRHVGVQHHHAHIASCLADNGHDGPVIGVAFDGLGYGTDGTLWGGEFLLADLADFERLAHLDPVPLPGGATAIRQPWRMAVSYLAACADLPLDDGIPVLGRNTDWPVVASMVERGVNSPATSSAGRLFDAAAAILGVGDRINYEGQAAVELEQLADRAEQGEYSARVNPGQPLRAQGTDLIRAVVADLMAGIAPARIAARFHNGVARLIVEVCCRLREDTTLSTVALSGGVFQNVLLLERTVSRLEGVGFHVLVHSRVPPNDGGISLGQAVIAGARDRKRVTS